MGEKMAERFLPLYLIAMGGGILSVGFLNGMDNLLSSLYSFPGGFVSDKIGYKRALVVFNIMAIIGYSIVLFVPYWWAVLVGALLFQKSSRKENKQWVLQCILSSDDCQWRLDPFLADC